MFRDLQQFSIFLFCNFCLLSLDPTFSGMARARVVDAGDSEQEVVLQLEY
jgi:hypothetical protein